MGKDGDYRVFEVEGSGGIEKAGNIFVPGFVIVVDTEGADWGCQQECGQYRGIGDRKPLLHRNRRRRTVLWESGIENPSYMGIAATSSSYGESWLQTAPTPLLRSFSLPRLLLRPF